MIDFQSKDALISQIMLFHPGARPQRFKTWDEYSGGMKDDGIWYYQVMIKSDKVDLEKCLELLKKNNERRNKIPFELDKMSAESVVKKIAQNFDDYIFYKLAGLIKNAKCSECWQEQKMCDNKNTLGEEGVCGYCGNDVK